jgi:Toprim-like
VAVSFDDLVRVLRETPPTPGWRPPMNGWKGISREVLDEAGVEVLDDGRGTVVPFRLPDGSVLYSKHIAITDESWYAPPPKEVGSLIPFGLDSIPWAGLRLDDLLVLAEGESDALAARQHLAELDGHRVFVLGCPGAKVWRPEWRRFVQRFATVYVVFDGDHAGKDGAWRVKNECRWVRIVRLPEGRDLRELLQAEGPEALLPFLDEADHELALDALLRALSDEQYRSLGLDPARIHAAELRLDPKRSKTMTDDDPAQYATKEFFCLECGDFRPHQWDGVEFLCQGCEVA